jgi:hypothetical protein
LRAEVDQRRIEEFERVLLAGSSVRVSTRELWRALAGIFPHRTPGAAERRLLLDVLKAIEARGSVRLPSERGKRWDRSMDPPVPASVDLVRERARNSGSSWRSFPWHQDLHWVAQCRNLSAHQIEFLGRVHDALVNGTFAEPAPLKYRSLQLTGDEKMLSSLATTSLFSEGHLTLDLLGCLPDAPPLAWEAVGEGGRMLIFENAGPFAVARRVLSELNVRPYDLVAFGGGRGVLAGLGHIKTIEQNVKTIHYVGDLDHAGLDIAMGVRQIAGKLGLPDVEPAGELYAQMLAAAEAFGHPQGWPAQRSFSDAGRRKILLFLPAELRDRIGAILQKGARIPEEVLGPEEFRNVWSSKNLF